MSGYDGIEREIETVQRTLYNIERTFESLDRNMETYLAKIARALEDIAEK